MSYRDIVDENLWIYDVVSDGTDGVSFTTCYGEKETDICFYIDSKMNWFTYTPYGDDVNLNNFFVDFCSPTEQEKDMFFMVTGYTIPWSEEHPLVL